MLSFISGQDFLEAYPSAYQPPPFRLKVQGDMIFFAFLWHFGHLIALVPILTNFSVIVPSWHLNSYIGIFFTQNCWFIARIVTINDQLSTLQLPQQAERPLKVSIQYHQCTWFLDAVIGRQRYPHPESAASPFDDSLEPKLPAPMGS